MASKTMTDEQLAEKYGRRTSSVIALFEPYWWGFGCPQGHRGTIIVWSKFKNHIWCHECRLDYPSEDCPLQQPSWMSPKEFEGFIAKLSFRPKILNGVDRSFELDKAEKEGNDVM